MSGRGSIFGIETKVILKFIKFWLLSKMSFSSQLSIAYPKITAQIQGLPHQNIQRAPQVFQIELRIFSWLLSLVNDGVASLHLFFLVQVVLFQINIFFHQLTQNTMTDFARFMKIYVNCSVIQNISFASFEFVQIFVNLTKQSSYFGLIGVQIC